MIKSYLCLFVCFITKLLHLEIVSDLTTESFLTALRRFTSHRGRPAHMHSDNSTAFNDTVGAHNELNDLGTFLMNEGKEIGESIERLGIQ